MVGTTCENKEGKVWSN